METIFLKLKNIVINYSVIFIIVLGVAMILFCFLAYETYTQNVFEDREELVSSYLQHGKYTYTAPVTERNPLYSKGTVLEMGKPIYFFTVSPNLDVSFAYYLNATDSASLRVECDTVVVATCMKNSGDSNNIVWKKEFPVKNMDYLTIKSGDAVIHNFSLNVTKIQSSVAEIQNKLKYSSNPKIEIITHVNYKGKINGEEVNNTTDFVLPLVINSAYYEMSGISELSENKDKYVKIKVRKEPSISTIKLPLSLFLLSTILIGILLPCTKMTKVDPEYIKKVEKKEKDSAFNKFVSKGKLPDNYNSLTQVEVYSLQDLVDAAIDMNERVVTDTKTGAYFIIHGNILYIFFDTG